MSRQNFPKPENELDERFLSNIEEVGWYCIGVPESEAGPSFAYSTGFCHTFDHPEILILGLDPAVGIALLNGIGEELKDGKKFKAGDVLEEIADGIQLCLGEIDKKESIGLTTYTSWFYQSHTYPMLQCFWPDRDGHFPWDQSCDHGVRLSQSFSEDESGEGQVDCTKHGSQERTFVCQHLAAKGVDVPLGFFWASEPRGDAWCFECEEVRLREGGSTGDWNDKSEDFARIKIVCGVCYDEIKAFQRSDPT